MLHRAISNLLSNALRYTSEGKTISVEILQKEMSVLVVVENHGEPIAPNILRSFSIVFIAWTQRGEKGVQATQG